MCVSALFACWVAPLPSFRLKRETPTSLEGLQRMPIMQVFKGELGQQSHAYGSEPKAVGQAQLVEHAKDFANWLIGLY